MMRSLLLAILLALTGIGTVLADESELGCPSLTGTWAGMFEGHAIGSWEAQFSQEGRVLEARAKILVDGIRAVEATGSADVTCEDGVTRLGGSGKAGGKKGTFTGAASHDGKSLLGTWASDKFGGTWNGDQVSTELIEWEPVQPGARGGTPARQRAPRDRQPAPMDRPSMPRGLGNRGQ